MTLSLPSMDSRRLAYQKKGSLTFTLENAADSTKDDEDSDLGTYAYHDLVN